MTVLLLKKEKVEINNKPQLLWRQTLCLFEELWTDLGAFGVSLGDSKAPISIGGSEPCSCVSNPVCSLIEERHLLVGDSCLVNPR